MAHERTPADREFLDEVRRNRAALEAQVKYSQQTVEKSKELLRLMDEIIAKAEKSG